MCDRLYWHLVTVAWCCGLAIQLYRHALHGMAMHIVAKACHQHAASLSLCRQVGGEHGVGRIDIVENRFVGMKVCTTCTPVPASALSAQRTPVYLVTFHLTCAPMTLAVPWVL